MVSIITLLLVLVTWRYVGHTKRQLELSQISEMLNRIASEKMRKRRRDIRGHQARVEEVAKQITNAGTLDIKLRMRRHLDPKLVEDISELSTAFDRVGFMFTTLKSKRLKKDVLYWLRYLFTDYWKLLRPYIELQKGIGDPDFAVFFKRLAEEAAALPYPRPPSLRQRFLSFVGWA